MGQRGIKAVPMDMLDAAFSEAPGQLAKHRRKAVDNKKLQMWKENNGFELFSKALY